MSVLALLLLAATNASPAEPIAMSSKSWGKPLTEWIMQPDGSIEYAAAVDRPDGDFRHYDIEVRRTPPDAARRRWLAGLLAPARKAVSRPPACGNRLTDLVYGDVRWGSIVLRFDSGCRGVGAMRVNRRLQQADAQVRTWALKVPVASRRAATLE